MTNSKTHIDDFQRVLNNKDILGAAAIYKLVLNLRDTSKHVEFYQEILKGFDKALADAPEQTQKAIRERLAELEKRGE